MDNDDVCCDACGDTVVVCCCGGSNSGSSSSGTSSALSCCCLLLATLTVAALLIAAFAFVVPVRVTVDDAVLGRLTLAVSSPANGTGTGTTTATVSYDISLAVSLHNHNWAMAIWRRGTLDTELRFRGRTLARARLAGAAGRRPDKIRALKMGVYHMSAAAEGAPVELGPGDAAEFARETAAGAFELELAVFGEVQYEAHPRRRAVRVTCPLKLSPSTATAPAAFARVKCA
ncbi:unnamed protein product [Urochloa humidicola]